MHPKAQVYFRTTIFFALVAAVAAAAALVLFLLVLRPQVGNGHSPAGLYQALELSADEQERVDEVYDRYAAERADLLDEFHRLQRTLAGLLQEEDQYSQRLAETVARLHAIHAELQEISIQRFFAVLEVLPPEKREELRQFAADTLSQPE